MLRCYNYVIFCEDSNTTSHVRHIHITLIFAFSKIKTNFLSPLVLFFLDESSFEFFYYETLILEQWEESKVRFFLMCLKG